MQIPFTLVTADQQEYDLLLIARANTSFSQVRPQLAQFDLAINQTKLFVGAHELTNDCQIGLTPLIAGARINVGTADHSTTNKNTSTIRQLHVIAGPDAGHVLNLSTGVITIGRGFDTELSIDDPELSRSHARLVIGEKLELTDLASTNGTTVEQQQVNVCDVEPGQVIGCGSSLLTITEPTDPALHTTEDAAGYIKVLRPPRFVAPNGNVVISYPAAPAEPPRVRIPWFMALAPLLAAGAMWWLSGGNSIYLVLILLSPLFLLINAVTDRIFGVKEYRKSKQAHAKTVHELQKQQTAAQITEARIRRREYLDPAAIWLMAQKVTSRLWERRMDDPDALVVRVGSGTLPARLRIEQPITANSQPAQTHALVTHVPAVVPLGQLGVLGIAGPERFGSARWVIAQLTALHPPDELRFYLLAGEDGQQRWRWLQWLGHCATLVDGQQALGYTKMQRRACLTELQRLIAQRHETKNNLAGPDYVVIVDDADLRRVEIGLAEILRDGPAVRVQAICLSAQPLSLPTECRATFTTHDEAGATAELHLIEQTVIKELTIEAVSQKWIDGFARGLAPLRDATPIAAAGRIPATVRLFDLLTHEQPDRPGIALARNEDQLCDPTEIRARWHQCPRSSRFLLGMHDSGPVEIDLDTDGPHALVAGTTGSGKSELLQTIVAGLALVNRPDELVFILIDYKGGAAFAECAKLPHTIGMVTDLDGRLTVRALSSLRAEIRRREKVLATHGVKNHHDYCQLRQVHASEKPAAMPRMVIVVDEFAALVEELPDFITGLVDVARRGRSLGIHLILATQRPSGVVSAEIRANTALRICLRVTDAEASTDVIDQGIAASIGQGQPGRGYVLGAAGLQLVQTAWVTGRSTKSLLKEQPVVRLWEPDQQETTNADVTDATATELAQLVTAIGEAAAGLPVISSPWLAPMAEEIELNALLKQTINSHHVVIGLQDLPEQQKQISYNLPIGTEAVHHLMVLGRPRSGRSTVLRTVAASLASSDINVAAQLYVVDCSGGSLLELAKLPQCVAVANREDLEHGVRVLHHLEQQIAANSRITKEGKAPILLLLDSWEGFIDSYGDVGHGELVELVARLLRDGPAAGLTAVITGERGLATHRISASISERLILAMVDTDSYALVGIPARLAPSAAPPGRALRCGEPINEVQIAASAASISAFASETDRREAYIHRLPPFVELSELLDHQLPNTLPVGLGGNAVQPIGFELTDRECGALIAGPPGSGRSNALNVIGQLATLAGRPLAVVSARRNSKFSLPSSIPRFGRSQGTQLQLWLTGLGAQRAVILVDDADALVDSDVDLLLTGIVQEATHWVFATATSETLQTLFRGLTMELRRARTGVLLWPGRYDNDVFSVKLPAAPMPMYPGRGLFIVEGIVKPIQLAQ